MPNVLVVGGAGYVGGGVTESLAKNGIPFSVFDNLTYENHYLKPVPFIFGDIRDRDRLGELLNVYTHVLWLAALVGDGACAIHPELTWEINAASVQWLAENFKGRILFTSTCSVYGASDRPVRENSATNPLSVYAQSKLAAEKYLADKNALIFRLGTAYGLPDTYSRIRMDLAVNYMTMMALTERKLTVFGGSQWRPFIHVRDIGELLVRQLETGRTGIYNVASENLKIHDLAHQIVEATGCAVETTDRKFQDNRNYNADVSKALRDGILPETGLRKVTDGIGEIRRLVLEGRIRDLECELYSNERRMLSVMGPYLKGGPSR
jgi:nucleoside-diphosphate-sugar epimerase